MQEKNRYNFKFPNLVKLFTLVFKSATICIHAHKVTVKMGINMLPHGKTPWRRAWQPTPVFLLENPMDRGA